MEEISPFYQIKCLFGGMQNVGKSSILNILSGRPHDRNITATIGIDFLAMTKELEEYPLQEPLPKYYFNMRKMKDINSNKNCQTISINLWDSGGHTKYFSIVKSYLRDVDIAFLIFDMSNRESWNALEKWKTELENHCKNRDHLMLVLVGSKSDLRHKVSLEEIKERSERWNAKSYIVSCLQTSSRSIIYRMLYKSVQDYHEHILNLEKEGKELPKHVLKSHYRTKFASYLDLDSESRSKFCCFQ